MRLALGWWLALTVVLSLFCGQAVLLAVVGHDVRGTITAVGVENKRRNPGQVLTVAVEHEGKPRVVTVHRSRLLSSPDHVDTGTHLTVRVGSLFGVTFANESVWMSVIVWLFGIVVVFLFTIGLVLREYVVLRFGIVTTTTEVSRRPNGPVRYRFTTGGDEVVSSMWVQGKPPSTFSDTIAVVYLPQWPQLTCLPEFAVWQAD